MTTINIKQPNGYLLDADGRVVIRFGAWETGERFVPAAVESVEYVNGPAAHTREAAEKYRSGPS